jgi:hypothetical protein
MEGMVMREGGSVGMVSFVMGIGGELGSRSVREAPVSLEILSVGPQFREVDYRKRNALTRRPPFIRLLPM